MSPQAASGVLCLYIKGARNATPTADFPNGLRVLNISATDPGVETYGGEMFIFAAGAGRFFADGTWAVTGN